MFPFLISKRVSLPYHDKELGPLPSFSASAQSRFSACVGTRAFTQESQQRVKEFLVTASPPSFPPNMHLARIFQRNQFLHVCDIHPRLCGARSRLPRATLGRVLHWRWKITCTAAHQSEDFVPFLLSSAQFIIRELCQSPACGPCSCRRIQPPLRAAVRAPAASALRKLLLLDLKNSVQVSCLGCQLSPSQCQICLAGIARLGSSSIQLLPQLEAEKRTLLGWL